MAVRLLLGFLLIFSIIGIVLLGVGAGIGFLLHWLIPAVDLGVGILIGVITIGFTAQLFARIVSLPISEPEEEIAPVAPPLPQRITYLIDPEPPRRGRRRKSTSS